MARNLSALIVDPNGDSALDAGRTVEAIGLDRVGEAGYGTEAMVLAAEHYPTVILVAIEDPPARGLSMLESLQQLLPDTPVIVYSSSADRSLMRQAMRWGARDYLAKPLQANELREAVHTVLMQDEHRQMARFGEQTSATARGTVITVAGAKGGIGKSTISTNLAIALRMTTGQEVALVDGDAQFGDLSVMLDMDVERSVADLARNEPTLTRDAVLQYLHRHRTGVNVLLAASEPDDWRALQPEHVSAIARALSETHEFVVFDTPGTMNDVVAASLNEAGIVMLVTSLDVSSIKDTRTALRIFEAWAYPVERVRLVVNDNNRAAAVTAADVEQACGVKVTEYIEYEQRVGLGVQTGIPIVESQPRSKFARSITAIAESIAGVQSVSDRGRMRSSPLARVPILGRLSA